MDVFLINSRVQNVREKQDLIKVGSENINNFLQGIAPNKFKWRNNSIILHVCNIFMQYIIYSCKKNNIIFTKKDNILLLSM